MHFAVTIYYTIISKILKIRQKFKNNPIVKNKGQYGFRIRASMVLDKNYLHH